MIIKKYQALNETDAIILAKEDLGKDIIIMNVKKITPKGLGKLFKKSKVEVTAALDDKKSYAQASEEAERKEKLQLELMKAKKQKEEAKNDKIEVKLDNIQSLIENKIEKFQREEAKENKGNMLIKEIGKNNSKDIKDTSNDEIIDVKVENKLTETKDKKLSSKSEKCVSLIRKQMLKHEVDEQYIDMIFNEVKASIKKDAPVDNILTSIYQKIILKLGQPKVIEPGEKKPKYIFFMGPTGVGKTTTIAKIASEFKVKKKLNIALATADTYRVAAVEQLRTYANILSVPLNVLYSAEDLEKLKPTLDRYDVVLIDTAGRSHKNAKQRDDLRKLINTIDEKDRDEYLVLSITTKYNDLTAIVDAYSDIKDYKLLFTKIDETMSIGNILNIKLLTNAKLSYITCGQEVPDDISKLDAQSIAKQLLGGEM